MASTRRSSILRWAIIKLIKKVGLDIKLSKKYPSKGNLQDHMEGIFPMKNFKIVVEKHPDTYVAYPLGFKGVVVGQGDTYNAALADVKSAIIFHTETFVRRWGRSLTI